MALIDVNFVDGDRQNYLLEIPLGTLSSPQDIWFDKPVQENKLTTGNSSGFSYASVS